MKIPSSTRPLPSARGVSLLELMVVLSILTLLLSMLWPSYNFFRRKAEDAVCMQNLRSLHASAHSYLQDHNFVWPQPLEGTENDSDEEADTKFWIEAIRPYGGTREVWLCPSERSGFEVDNADDFHSMSYVPTEFDDLPNTAFKWTNQPWFIERGGFHQGNQANLIMPDGSLRKDEGLSPF
jgi:prepilin-type N-terminal cleavage/methylation domain-containing protein